MARMSLPPGFRFHPTDVELVKYYLKRRTLGKKFRFEAIAELNIYKYSPWDLPDKSCLKAKDLEWYFFCPKERKYASGARSNRATESGYWKSTGKDRAVLHNDQTVGMVKTLVFHQGHAPKGERTDWVIHEYRILDKELSDLGVAQDAYVLCKVFKKSGPGPKNGAQYGAPFVEEEWDDDDNEMCPKYLPCDCLPQSSLPSNSVVTSMFFPGSTSTIPLSEPGPSKAPPPAEDVPPPTGDDEDITTLLEMFTEDGSLPLEQSSNDKVENLGGVENCDGLTRSDVDEIFNGLADLDNWDDELPGGGLNFSCEKPTTGYGVQPMLGGNGNNDGNDVAGYVELNDLNSPLYFTTSGSGSGPKHGFTETTVEPNFFSNVEQHPAAFDDFFGAVQHNNIFLP